MHDAYPCMIEPVQHHGGTIIQVMGDGLLAFFGAPVGHEDDPERLDETGVRATLGTIPYRLFEDKGAGTAALTH